MSYSTPIEEIRTVCEDLRQYADMEGTEVGEACLDMINLAGHPDYISDELLNALVKEMKEMLYILRHDYEIVEEEKTHKYIDKHLEYKGS